MLREDPFFKKCCFCIPLKSCLQVWSGIKVVLDLTIAGFFIFLVKIIAKQLLLNRLILYLIIIAVFSIDCFFQLVLTASLCTNNLRTLRVFYYYSFYMVFLSVTFVIGFIIYWFIECHGKGDVIFCVVVICLLINTALDVCIIFTLKSEMIKLRNKQQYEFANLSREEGEFKEPVPFQVVENVAETI